MSSNSVVVAAFYDQKTQEKWHEKRADSPILPLLRFNNWIKACLIKEYTPPLANVLDLCCGRGGDLSKWEHAEACHVYCVDASAESIAETIRRYKESDAAFSMDSLVADVSSCDTLGNNYYDIVSCQFALHYLFETRERASATLLRVAKSLKEGGYFLATIPSVARLFDLTQTNNFYASMKPSTINTRAYTFWLMDAIDHVVEFFVPLDELRTLAGEHGLVPVRLPTSFAEYAQQHSNKLKHMQPDIAAMPKDLWQACCLYDVVVFQKKGKQEGV